MYAGGTPPGSLHPRSPFSTVHADQQFSGDFPPFRLIWRWKQTALQAHLALEEIAAGLSGGECYAGYRQK
jgi:hypothetical protein